MSYIVIRPFDKALPFAFLEVSPNNSGSASNGHFLKPHKLPRLRKKSIKIRSPEKLGDQILQDGQTIYIALPCFAKPCLSSLNIDKLPKPHPVLISSSKSPSPSSCTGFRSSLLKSYRCRVIFESLRRWSVLLFLVGFVKQNNGTKIFQDTYRYLFLLENMLYGQALSGHQCIILDNSLHVTFIQYTNGMIDPHLSSEQMLGLLYLPHYLRCEVVWAQLIEASKFINSGASWQRTCVCTVFRKNQMISISTNIIPHIPRYISHTSQDKKCSYLQPCNLQHVQGHSPCSGFATGHGQRWPAIATEQREMALCLTQEVQQAGPREADLHRNQRKVKQGLHNL